MTDIPFPILVAVTFFFGCLFVLHLHIRNQEAQRALPAREDYLARHGQQTPACHHCGSANLTEIGMSDGNDDHRMVSCADCRKKLYRYERETSRHSEEHARDV